MSSSKTTSPGSSRVRANTSARRAIIVSFTAIIGVVVLAAMGLVGVAQRTQAAATSIGAVAPQLGKAHAADNTAIDNAAGSSAVVDSAVVDDAAADTQAAMLTAWQHARFDLDTPRTTLNVGYMYSEPGGESHGGELIGVIDGIDCRDVVEVTELDSANAEALNKASNRRVIDNAVWLRVTPHSVYHFANADLVNGTALDPRQTEVTAWVKNTGFCI